MSGCGGTKGIRRRLDALLENLARTGCYFVPIPDESCVATASDTPLKRQLSIVSLPSGLLQNAHAEKSRTSDQSLYQLNLVTSIVRGSRSWRSQNRRTVTLPARS
jgi:hypothetical protein